MARKTAAGKPVRKRAPKVADKGPESKKPRTIQGAKKCDRLATVRNLIGKWEEKIQEDVTKGGVTELIRLFGLEKEMSETRETAKEIKVTWVEPTEAESSKSE